MNTLSIWSVSVWEHGKLTRVTRETGNYENWQCL